MGKRVKKAKNTERNRNCLLIPEGSGQAGRFVRRGKNSSEDSAKN
jgi:hypothetical protein